MGPQDFFRSVNTRDQSGARTGVEFFFRSSQGEEACLRPQQIQALHQELREKTARAHGCLAQGKIGEAISLSGEALALSKAAFSEDSQAVKVISILHAQSLFRGGRFAHAEVVARGCLSIAGAGPKGARELLALTLLELNEHVEAKGILQRLVEEAVTPRNLEDLAIRGAFIRALAHTGDLKTTGMLQDFVAELRDSKVLCCMKGVEFLHRFSLQLGEEGHSRESIAVLRVEQRILFSEALSGEEFSPHRQRNLTRLEELLFSARLFAEHMDVAERLLDTIPCRLPNNHEKSLAVRIRLAASLRRFGKSIQAESALHKHLSILCSAEPPLSRAVFAPAYLALAEHYLETGQFKLAQKNLGAAFHTAPRKEVGFHRIIAETEAKIYLGLGETSRGEVALKHALHLLEKESKNDNARFFQGRIQLIYGQLKCAAGSYEESLSWLARAEESLAPVGEEKLSPLYPDLLCAQGMLSLKKKELDAAEDFYTRALKYVYRFPPKVFFGKEFLARHGLAETELERGNYAAASRHAEEALEIAQKKGGNSPLSLLPIYRLLSRIRSAQGHVRAGQRYADKADALCFEVERLNEE